jgi:hypothetical protein
MTEKNLGKISFDERGKIRVGQDKLKGIKAILRSITEEKHEMAGCACNNFGYCP